MKRIGFAFAVFASIALSGAALADQVFTGGAPTYKEIQVGIDGRSVTVLRMIAFYHEMDLAPRHVQVTGLAEYFYVEKRKHPFEVDMCEKWVSKVDADEANWTEDAPTYPYLEIDIASNAKTINIHGMQIYRANDVLCWEARDFGPPRY